MAGNAEWAPYRGLIKMALFAERGTGREPALPEFVVELELSVSEDFRKYLRIHKAALEKLGAEVSCNKDEPGAFFEIPLASLTSPSEMRGFAQKILAEIPPDEIKYSAFHFSGEIDVTREELRSLDRSPLKPRASSRDERAFELTLAANSEPVLSIIQENDDNTSTSVRIERNERKKAPRYDVLGDVEFWEDLQSDKKPHAAVTASLLVKMAERMHVLRERTINWLRG